MVFHSTEGGLFLCELKSKLQHSLTEEGIESIEDNLKTFAKLKRRDPEGLQRLIEKEEKDCDFNEVWKFARHQFSPLDRFVGSFATTFSNTATVESDFY